MSWYSFTGKEKAQDEPRVSEQEKHQEDRARKTSAAVEAAMDKNRKIAAPLIDSITDVNDRTSVEQVKQHETLKQNEDGRSEVPEGNELDKPKSETTNAIENGEPLTTDEGNGASEPTSGESGATQQVLQKDVVIEAEYIRAMYEAILENKKYSKNAAEGFETLVSMITELSAGTITQLGETSAQLRMADEELKRLKAEAEDRSKVIDRLSRENSRLKDKCDECDIKIAEKDDQISRVNGELKVSQEKCDEKDCEIAALNKARQDADAAHTDELAKLKTAHNNAIADLEKKHDEEVGALNKSAADQIEMVRKSVDEFVPAGVCDLFDYRVGEPVEDRSRWQAIYAYLGFINGNLRQDAFVKRFREFDAALYDAMRDNPDQLAECRVRVQRHVNEEIGKKSGGLLVCWPKIGEACNPDQYTTTSDFGQRISEVISAMIYKKDDGGKVLCQSKGKVATV